MPLCTAQQDFPSFQTRWISAVSQEILQLSVCITLSLTIMQTHQKQFYVHLYSMHYHASWMKADRWITMAWPREHVPMPCPQMIKSCEPWTCTLSPVFRPGPSPGCRSQHHFYQPTAEELPTLCVTNKTLFTGIIFKQYAVLLFNFKTHID